MSDEADIARIRAEHATMLREKAEAEAVWHAEVRATLKHHGESLVAIKQTIENWSRCNARIDGLEARVKALEDFKIRIVAYWVAATMAVIVFWRIIEHFFK